MIDDINFHNIYNVEEFWDVTLSKWLALSLFRLATSEILQNWTNPINSFDFDYL